MGITQRQSDQETGEPAPNNRFIGMLHSTLTVDVITPMVDVFPYLHRLVMSPRVLLTSTFVATMTAQQPLPEVLPPTLVDGDLDRLVDGHQ